MSTCDRHGITIDPGTICDHRGQHVISDPNRYARHLERQAEQYRIDHATCVICRTKGVSEVHTRGQFIGWVCQQHNTVEARQTLVIQARQSMDEASAKTKGA